MASAVHKKEKALASSRGVDISGGGEQGPVMDQDKPISPDPSLVPLFPMGSAALFKLEGSRKVALDPGEKVTLVNVSLAAVSIRTADESIKPTKGTVEKRVRVRPFGTITLPVLYAQQHFRSCEGPGKPRQLMVAARDGDCKGMKFTTRGPAPKEFSTCPFAKCATCGPLPSAPIPCHWSVFQVQHCIGQLFRTVAIQRVIETIDTRPAVMMWGMYVSRERQRTLDERKGRAGVGNLADPDIVF